MLHQAGKLWLLAVVFVAPAAWAGPLALWSGQMTFIGVPARGSTVQLSDASVVEVQTSKSGISLTARRPGVSQVTLRLRDGDTYVFTVHVTPEGAEVYSTSRSESEHSGFTLPPPQREGKRGAPARGAKKGRG